MPSADDIMRDLDLSSDLDSETSIFDAIDIELRRLFSGLALFTFTTRSRSSAARSNSDGSVKTCPIIHLYLWHDTDFDSTGVDRHQGNWGDEWNGTESVRKTINSQLLRASLGEDYLDDQTFVFLDTIERIAFDRIGRLAKESVARLVREKTGATPKDVFWSSNRDYTVVFKDKADYKKAKRLSPQIKRALQGVFKAADQNQYCQNYRVGLNLGYGEMNLYRYGREE